MPSQRLETRPSTEWLANLYDTHYDGLFAFAYRRLGQPTDAQDLVATVFLDLVRHLRAGKGLEPPVAAWLYTVASRRVADHWRKQGRTTARHLPGDPTPMLTSQVDPAPTPGDQAEQRLRLDLLHAALAKLEPLDRQVIEFCYFGELSHATVAQHLATSAANVAVRLHRAIARLRKHYHALAKSAPSGASNQTPDKFQAPLGASAREGDA